MDSAHWHIAAQTRDRLGESPMWHRHERALYWVDWYGPIVHRLRMASGELESWTIPGASLLGSLVFAPRGRLLLALDAGLKLFDPTTGELSSFADPNARRSGVSYNDSKVDRSGRYWVGTFDIAETEPRGILYCLDATARASLADSGFAVCNGPAFSPDGAILYFSDTVGRRILAYDVEEGGARLVNRRLFAAFAADEGMPDGLTVDSAGDIWCAHYGAGRVTRFSAAGERLEILPLPVANVTSCCLGGDDLKTLYVTTGWSPGTARAEDEPGDGGAVFARHVPTPGLAEREYAMSGPPAPG